MGNQPIRIQLGKILWENLAGKSCGKLLQENLVGNLAGNSDRKILWEIVVGKSCGKFLWENLARNCCWKILWKFLQEIVVGKSWGKLLWEILVGKSCRKSCGKFLWENLVGNCCGKSCGKFFRLTTHLKLYRDLPFKSVQWVCFTHWGLGFFRSRTGLGYPIAGSKTQIYKANVIKCLFGFILVLFTHFSPFGGRLWVA